MEQWQDWEAVGVCHSLHALARLAAQHNASTLEFRSAALAYFDTLPAAERSRNPIAMMYITVRNSTKPPLEIAHDIAELLSASRMISEGRN